MRKISLLFFLLTVFIVETKRSKARRCLVRDRNINLGTQRCPVAEFKEFERRFKFKPRFKYGWLHLKLYQMFQDLSRRFI